MKKIKRYWFLLFMLSLGVVFGIIFIYFINDVDKLIINSELKEYLNIINKNKVSFSNGIINSFIENFVIYFIVWCSGFIFILLPITYFLVFYKGFIIGFLFSSLIYCYKLKGILLFIVFIFPSELLYLIFLIILVFIISKFSKKFINVLLNKDNFDLKKLIFKYFKILIFIIIITFLIALCEVFINYYLIRAVL